MNAAKNGGCPLWFIPQARYVRERFQPDWLLVQLFDNDPDEKWSRAMAKLGIDAHMLSTDSGRA